MAADSSWLSAWRGRYSFRACWLTRRLESFQYIKTAELASKEGRVGPSTLISRRSSNVLVDRLECCLVLITFSLEKSCFTRQVDMGRLNTSSERVKTLDHLPEKRAPDLVVILCANRPVAHKPNYFNDMQIERDVTSVVHSGSHFVQFCMAFIEERYLFETSQAARTWRMCKI